jgi:FtsH-binding integral membrane protein
MSYAMYPNEAAAFARSNERAAFIRRTYAHLAGAVLAFAAIDIAIFNLFTFEQIQGALITFFRTPLSQLILLVAFIGVGWLARTWAYNGGSEGMQYLGLSLYVIFEALIFVPILFVAVNYSNKDVLPTAAIMTLCMFGGLTMAVLTTRSDFTFLGPILSIAGFLMLGLIIASWFIGGFSMGLVIGFFGVALACGYILYDTSNVLHRFRTDQHVAASLELFASLAYLFYYVLYILIQLSGNRRD